MNFFLLPTFLRNFRNDKVKLILVIILTFLNVQFLNECKDKQISKLTFSQKNKLLKFFS